MAEIADAGEVEPPGVTPHEPRGALLVVGPAPPLAEGTSGVEPTGEAERAAAAKFEGLVSWAQGVARQEVESAA